MLDVCQGPSLRGDVDMHPQTFGQGDIISVGPLIVSDKK